MGRPFPTGAQPPFTAFPVDMRIKLYALGPLLFLALPPCAPTTASSRMRRRERATPFVSRGVRWPGLGTEAGMAY